MRLRLTLDDYDRPARHRKTESEPFPRTRCSFAAACRFVAHISALRAVMNGCEQVIIIGRALNRPSSAPAPRSRYT